MRRIILVILALGLLAGPFMAAQAANERQQARDYFGRESVVCGPTSTALGTGAYADPAHPPVAQFALITVEGATMRWNATGHPADANATPVAADATLEIHGINSIRNFRCYNALSNAHIRVQYAR